MHCLYTRMLNKKGGGEAKMKKLITFISMLFVLLSFSSVNASEMADIASELGISEETAATLDLWLEADSGVAADENGYITEWKDKTGNYNFSGGEASSGIKVAETIYGTPTVRFNKKYLTHNFSEENYYTGKYTLVLFVGVNKNVSGMNNIFTVNSNYWGVGMQNANMRTYVKGDDGASYVAIGTFNITPGAALSMYSLRNEFDADDETQTYNWNLHRFSTNGGGFTSNGMASGSVRGQRNYAGLHTIQQYRIGDSKEADLDVSGAMLFKTALTNTDVASIYSYFKSKYSVPTASQAECDESGAKVSITIKGSLESTPDPSEFSVTTSNGEILVTGASVVDNKIVLTLDKNLNWREDAYISYSGTAIKEFYDMEIVTTTIKEPAKFISAAVSSDGTKILVKIENEVLKSLNKEDFSVICDGIDLTVVEVFEEDGYVNVKVSPSVAYGAENVAISYDGKAIYSDEGGSISFDFTKFVDSSGIDQYSITNLSAVRTENVITVTGSCTRNDSNALANVTILIAAFDGTEMTGFNAFSMENLNSSVPAEINETITIKGTEANLTLKMYMCNNLDIMSPLMAEIPIVLN